MTSEQLLDVDGDPIPELSTLGPQQIRSLKESKARINVFEGAIFFRHEIQRPRHGDLRRGWVLRDPMDHHG
jgi:hypothetical protein